MSRAADLARKCFAVARSTNHEGERAAALDRGMALLEKHGLNPDHFDIPGRARPEPQAQPWPDFVDGMKARHEYGTRQQSSRPFYADVAAEEARIVAAAAALARHEAAMKSGQQQAFSMDSIVRAAVAETIRRRREEAFRAAMAKRPE